MNQDLPPPPWELRPWYYQNLFLVAAFVLWPAWPVLMIRSPWHNGILSGGVAWAALIVGSVAAFKSVQAGSWDLILLYYVPGLVLTFALQVFWTSYKKQYLGPYLPGNSIENSDGASGASGAQDSTASEPDLTSGSTPRARLRRRSRSRRTPRR